MYCVNCGKSYDPSHKFCNHCGRSIRETGIVAGDTRPAQAQPIIPANEAARTGSPPSSPVFGARSTVQDIETPPYARFVLQTLACLFLLSIAVLNVAVGASFEPSRPVVLPAVAIIATIFFALQAKGSWRRILVLEPQTETTLRRRHRNVLIAFSVIALLSLSAALGVGLAIGKNRAEAAQLVTDLRSMAIVGDRISNARNAVEPTISSHLQMYKVIEADVEDLEATLLRLKPELALYDSKFPEHRKQTFQSIANVDVTLRRAELLKQQIAIAKQIELLDLDQQRIAWQAGMQPLLAKEDALDRSK